jgi:hypothetical protein
LKKIEKKNVLVLRRPEDEAISLFAGLLANPDMTLSPLNIKMLQLMLEMESRRLMTHSATFR